MPALTIRENNRGQRTRFALANMQEPDTIIELAHRKEYSLTGDHRYQTIACLSGSVWITQEGDRQDYLLEDGDVFIITNRGRVIVRALKDSSIGLSPKLKSDSVASRMRHTIFH